MPHLRRVRQTAPGLTRRRAGRGFVYLDENGTVIRDPNTIERIRALAIPPAWKEVWICADERGHLQATGTDDAGRRQYLYHPAWRARQDRRKFVRIEAFAAGLPEARERVARDLRRRGLPRARVLACAVRLLDRGLFRIGSEDYAEDNGSFGLATLRKDHTTVRRDHVEFDFIGKGGKRLVREVHDPQLLPVLRALRRRRNGGDELLAWREGDEWRDVRSSDINVYLKEITGEDTFSAKDFRTWHATVLAAVLLAEHGAVPSERRATRVVSGVVRDVAEQLGNTPAVARASYIDPRVIECYRDGRTIELPDRWDERDTQLEIEAAVLDLIGSGNDRAVERAA
jgi:DNA topoisomerase I